MQKIIRNRIYDTENATIIKKYTYGYFGSDDGYEEILFKTPDNFYFVYSNGGVNSIHKTENIKPIAKNKADEWLENH